MSASNPDETSKWVVYDDVVSLGVVEPVIDGEELRGPRLMVQLL